MPTDKPECYGFLHGELAQCPCALGQACVGESAFWSDRLSLTEHAEGASAVFDLEDVVDTTGALDPVELYARLHEQYFGRRPSKRSLDTPRVRKTLHGLVPFCANAGVSIALYIGAQMHAMRMHGVHLKRVKGRVLGFQVNMLVGWRAMERYHIDESKAVGRFHTTNAMVFSRRGFIGEVLERLSLGEIAVGEYFIAAAVSGTPVTWSEAIVRTFPDKMWCAFNCVLRDSGNDSLWTQYLRSSRIETLRKCWQVAVLQSAVFVTNGYRTGLAERVGLRGEFTWKGLAEFLLRTFGVREKAEALTLPRGIGELKWG